VPTPGELAKLGQAREEAIVNEILAEVFEEMQGLFNCRTKEAAAEFGLDVATRRIPVEAASVLLSDINSSDLVFTAVRGEAGHRLKGRKVKMGRGIVGFAAKQGVAIAIADVTKDSRFRDDIDKETGFTTRSVIVAPLVHDGRTYGAIEMLNRKGAEVFLQTETSVISYIATLLAEHLGTVISLGADLDFAAAEHFGKARAAAAASRAAAAKKRAGPVPTGPARTTIPAPGGSPSGKKKH
jgi:signal transduction protein with GAF and PtsI domain